MTFPWASPTSSNRPCLPAVFEENQADIYETPFDNLHIITATAELADLQPKLEAKHKINKLRKLLDELDGEYDRIYLDTPPALNFYAVSALIAADRVLIPFDCDSFSRQALYGLLAEIEELKEDHNDGLEVEGIVVNQFQAGPACRSRFSMS